MHEYIRRAVRRVAVPLALGLPVGLVSPVVAAAPEPGCASLEGCYSYEEMEEFLEVAKELVLEFVYEEYSPQLLWVDLRFVPDGDSGESGCRDPEGGRSRYTENSFMYCSVDNTIYIGQKELWSFYSKIGDVAPIVGFAHEVGHFLQSVGGVPHAATPKENVHRENQADCFAGAWFGYADRTGLVERPDDLKDIALILERIASSEEEKGRTHGTVEERKRSFEDGRFGGLEACNGYYPATPVHSEKERDRWRAALATLHRRSPARRKSDTRPRRAVGLGA